VHALSYTVDIAGICGVPERGGVALMGFRGKKELKGDVGGGRGVVDERVRLVVGADLGAQLPYPLLCVVSTWCSCKGVV
jgi:hypothetical protein